MGKADLGAVAALGSGRGGRPRAVAREAVVQAALDVIQRDGLGGLTLRRVATDLGVGVSTVHSAVGSKEDLLQAVADLVLSQVPGEALDREDPVEALIDYLLEVHRLLLRFPAVAQLSVIGPQRNPSVFKVQDQVVRSLRAAGLDIAAAVTAHSCISSYTFGYTLMRIAGEGVDRRDLIADLDPEEHPGLHGLLPHLAAQRSDEQFRLEIACIIGGFLHGTRHV